MIRELGLESTIVVGGTGQEVEGTENHIDDTSEKVESPYLQVGQSNTTRKVIINGSFSEWPVWYRELGIATCAGLLYVLGSSTFPLALLTGVFYTANNLVGKK